MVSATRGFFGLLPGPDPLWPARDHASAAVGYICFMHCTIRISGSCGTMHGSDMQWAVNDRSGFMPRQPNRMAAALRILDSMEQHFESVSIQEALILLGV